MTLLLSAGESLWVAIQLLILSALIFAWIALVVKGRAAITAAERARKELRVNLSIYFLDALFIGPLVAVGVEVIRHAVNHFALELIAVDIWLTLPWMVTLLAVLFVGDFVSYLRHRVEHTRLLWPAHAIHHSDTEMTWLTLSRFHPINRFTTMALDTSCLALLGFPEWALIANLLVRHYYGQLIHADLPWTYGPLGRILVSPVMHRWHHARDVTGSGSNFASIFSVFDQIGGTYYVPGVCDVPLGVNDKMGPGTAGQLMYPFSAWHRRFTNARRRRTQSTQRAEAS